MKIFIAKFYGRVTHRKYAVRVDAANLKEAMELVRDNIQKRYGCYIISVCACPLQEV